MRGITIATLAAVLLVGALLWALFRGEEPGRATEGRDAVALARGESAATPDEIDAPHEPELAPAALESSRKTRTAIEDELADFIGRVVDLGDDPIAGALVVRSQSGRGPSRIPRGGAEYAEQLEKTVEPENLTRTDASGYFSFRDDDPAVSEILVVRVVHHRDYLQLRPSWRLLRGELATLHMTRMDAAQLSVNALDATTKNGVPEFSVYVHVVPSSGDDDWPPQGLEGREGVARGEIRFPRGCKSVEVIASAAGMTEEDREDPLGPHRDSFAPAPGGVHRLTLELILDRAERDADVLLQGIVLSAKDDTPIAKAEVFHLERKVETGSDGRFRIATLEGGTVYARAAGHARVDAEAVPGEELVLRLGECSRIEGRLVDELDQPVPGVDIRLRCASEGPLMPGSDKASTDDEGRFVFEDLCAGRFVLTWGMPDEAQDAARARFRSVELGDGETVELELLLDTSEQVALNGILRLEGFDEERLILVLFPGGEEGSAAIAEVEDGGSYTIVEIPPGTYGVMMYRDGESYDMLVLPSVEVVGPGRQVIDFEYEAASIKGRLAAPLEGKPRVCFVPHGADIGVLGDLLRSAPDGEFASKRVQEDGRFHIPLVAGLPGELRLYDGPELLASRPLDPRAQTDVGVWEVR